MIAMVLNEQKVSFVTLSVFGLTRFSLILVGSIRMTRARWYVAAYIAALLGVVVALALLGRPQIPLGLNLEVFKVIATLVGTGLLGVFATFAFNELNRQKERRDAELAMRRTMLADLIADYNGVKAIRRSLRAEIRPVYSDPTAHILKQRYLELLPKLNEAQLRLELAVRLIGGNKRVYPGHDELLKLISDSEKYLGALISEWENKSGLLLDAPATNALADLPVLRCFVNAAPQSFGPGFANPIGEALSKLAATLVAI